MHDLLPAVMMSNLISSTLILPAEKSREGMGSRRGVALRRPVVVQQFFLADNCAAGADDAGGGVVSQVRPSFDRGLACVLRQFAGVERAKSVIAVFFPHNEDGERKE